MVKGRIHSFQSLGAVDGPGLRYVIFMQGCPYSCPYCHNPDTKSFSGGNEYSANEIVEKVLRYKTYFGENGGVTLSGGEPLMQCEFAAELFEKFHACGVNTALDTAGVKPDEHVKKVLLHTDTVLCDIKYPDSEGYKKYFSASLESTVEFLKTCDEMGKSVTVRHVIVPDFTDSEESVKKIAEIAKTFGCTEKIELLPFHKMCADKYDRLGIPFPLADTPECAPATIDRLRHIIA
ncbi:MAG: pyruvate formate lyase-activating protein [Clostridia bacterium]|nr:pyruvate formate lyase-activating protein [Clostridia bacterium]